MLAEYIRSTFPLFLSIFFAVFIFQYSEKVSKPLLFVIFSTFKHGSIPIVFFFEKFYDKDFRKMVFRNQLINKIKTFNL